MELKNISANFLGDSITEGCGTSGADKTFHAVLAKRTGMKIARNYGIGGTRIADQKDRSKDPERNRSYCERFPSMDDDAELIVVFGGTNDFGHGDAAIGNFTDRTPETFYGACHYLMEGLMNKYPTSTIVIMTPIHRCSEDGIINENGLRRVLLKEYVNIIKEVAEYYSLPVLDLWSVSGIQPRVEINKKTYCPDGLHPNDLGHELIASRLEGFLKTL
jgi:lysophospholipase L1-like esterase